MPRGNTVSSAVRGANRDRQRAVAGYGGTASDSSSGSEGTSQSFAVIRPRRVARRAPPRRDQSGVLRRARKAERTMGAPSKSLEKTLEVSQSSSSSHGATKH